MNESLTIDTLLEAKKRIDDISRPYVRSFAGMKVICNPAIPDNEIMVVMGKEVYKLFLEEIEADD